MPKRCKGLVGFDEQCWLIEGHAGPHQLSPEHSNGDPRAVFAAHVLDECRAIADMLIAKNEAYGNSALNPLRCFSKADPIEQIKVRIDDKLSRLARGSNAGEDVERDLIGYLILLRIARSGGA